MTVGETSSLIVFSSDDGMESDMSDDEFKTCFARLRQLFPMAKYSDAHVEVLHEEMAKLDTLTLDRYTHAFKHDVADAINRMPDLTTPTTDGQAKVTGTDDATPDGNT